MTQLFTNGGFSSLASGIGSGDGSLSLASGEGARFPSPSSPDYFMLTLTQAGTETSWEIVKVTARSGDTLTITRAQEGTSAGTWSAGAKAELRVTAEWLNSPNTGIHRARAIREHKVTMAANDIDCASGSVFTKTISGNTTLTVSNVPASGEIGSFILDLTNGGSATITWWGGIKWPGGAAPALTASGRDVLGFFTHDGGTTWNGVLLGGAMA
jgi:hypothetical protein